jgi:hypothetical protein
LELPSPVSPILRPTEYENIPMGTWTAMANTIRAKSAFPRERNGPRKAGSFIDCIKQQNYELIEMQKNVLFCPKRMDAEREVLLLGMS